MLTIVSWLWGQKYDVGYVRRLAYGLQTHITQPYRTILLSDHLASAGYFDEQVVISDLALLEMPGCFARLRLFDPEWQAKHGISPGHRIVCIDLDVVVAGPLEPLFDRPEPFVILQGANSSNPGSNGSLWMLRAGYRPDVWSDFSIGAAMQLPCYQFPDDQGWFDAKIPDAAKWNCGPESGIWSFRKRGWPKDDRLPSGARLVVFPGWRDPAQFRHLSWIDATWS